MKSGEYKWGEEIVNSTGISKVDDIELKNVDVYYYKKKMETKTGDCYFSYVFFTKPMSADDLQENWNSITSVVAVDFQSKSEKLIERFNFYICFFVDEKIDNKLLNRIEGDEFCARKYVYYAERDENGCFLDQEKIVNVINRKLFDFRETTKSPYNNLYMNRMTLQNFRVYGDKFTIDFMYKHKEPATFVLIYAKNGGGKTCIFDGIEYLFKGTVNRIMKLQNTYNKSNTPAVAYHHLNNPDKDSFVTAYLSNNGLLKCRVISEKEKGNDLSKSDPIEGQDFIGTGEKRDRWKEIILPHDSIDGFTVARTPEDMYKEWIESSGLTEKSNRFINKYKEYRQSLQSIDITKKQLDESLRKLEELNKSKAELDELDRLVHDYNDLVQDEKNQINQHEVSRLLKAPVKELKLEALYFSVMDGVKSYDMLINKAEESAYKIEQYTNNYILPLEKKLPYYQSKGSNYYENIHERYIELEKRGDYFRKQLSCRIELDRITDALSLTKQSILDDELELRHVVTILALGGTNSIRKKEKRIEDLESLDTVYYEDAGMLDNEKKKSEIRIEEIQDTIDSLENLLADAGEREKVRSYAQEIDYYKEELLSYQKIIILAESNLKKLKDSVFNSEKKIVELGAITFSGTLADVDLEVVNKCSEILGDESISEIFLLLIDYSKIEKEIEILRQQLVHLPEEKDNLSSIFRLAKIYVAEHADTCDCPVCGKHFRTNKRLYSAIETHYDKQNISLNNSLVNAQIDAARLNQRYRNVCLHVEKEINRKIQELQNKRSHAKKEYGRLACEKRELEDRCIEIKTKIDNLRLLLQKYGDLNIKASIETVEKWYSARERELMEHKKQITIEKEKLTLVKERERDLHDEWEEAKIELNELKNIRGLNQCIEFLASKDNEWLAEEEKGTIDNALNKKKNRYKELLEQKRMYDEVEELSLNYIFKQIELCESEKEKLDEDNAIYSLYFSETNSDELQLGIQSIERLKQILKLAGERLFEIRKENSARNYFYEYRRTKDAEESQRNLLDKQKKVKSKYKKELDTLKNELERELAEYFNQSAMSDVYSKINPHREVKNVRYQIDFSRENKPQLFITASDGENEFRPEWYFSTAQLNTLAFSSFFSRALKSKLPLKTIFIDDPIAHFDDMNILGFADLMRCLIMQTPFQYVMSTHDRKIFDIMRRKLPEDLYKAKYIEL